MAKKAPKIALSRESERAIGLTAKSRWRRAVKVKPKT
jgi:hypothetical protein